MVKKRTISEEPLPTMPMGKTLYVRPIDGQLMRAFRAMCALRGIKIKHMIEKLMRNEIREYHNDKR